MNTTEAVRMIASVAEDTPDAVMLARLVSPAIRIEPHLLRLLRTSLLPEADVSAEADLWFSPLVESAGADSIVLDATIAEILRADLANETELFDRTTTLIREAHGHLPPALRLEEEVTAIALSGAPDATERIDAALAAALRTLTADPQRAKETARWFARAWPRLPDTVRRTRSAATLALAAGLLTGRRARTKPVDANARIDDVRWVFRDRSFTEFDNVDAFIEGDTVVFTDAGATGGMRVPRTDPRVVEMSFGTDGSDEPILVDASPGTAVAIPTGVQRITFTTLAGDVYELQRTVEGSTAAADSPDSAPPWIDISPFMKFANACVMVSAGVTAYRVARTGFRPTSQYVVTAREPLVFEEMLVVEPAAFGSKPRPRPDIEGPLLLIESNGPNAMGFSTPPLVGESDGPDDTALTARPENVVAIGYEGQELRAIAGVTMIDDPLADEFHVLVESAVPLPDEFTGGPAVIADRVCGVVTSVVQAEGDGGTLVLVVASGLVIRRAVERAAGESVAQEQTSETVRQAPSRSQFEENVQQAVSPEMPSEATGNRLAKIVIVARELEVAQEAVHALADRVVALYKPAPPRKGVSWNVRVENAPDVRAGVVFWAATADPDWPLVLDMRDAALAVIVDRPDVRTKGGQEDDAWADTIRATIVNGAPHVPVVRSSQLSGLTGMPFPSPEPGPIRELMFRMIHWAAQPEMDKETWESAPRLALQPPTSGPVGHARELFSQTGGWDAEIDRWLGILTGGRVVESVDIVFRDPEWFESIVGVLLRAVRSEQQTRHLPGLDLFSAQRILTAEGLLDESRLPVAPQSVVHAAATVLRDAGLAVIINTDYGTIMVVPSFALDGSGGYRSGSGDRVMSASWTGDVSSGFFAVAAAFEWSDGRVEEIGWHSQIAEGVAWVERDGRYRIEGRQSGQIADLVITQEEESVSGYSDRPLRMIRSALEEALADNRSLDIREERMYA